MEEKWNPKTLTGNMALRIAQALTLALLNSLLSRMPLLKEGSGSKARTGMQFGVGATFLGRLEKIGSLHPPSYPFVLGLCLEAKAIKQKTFGDAKKWKTNSPGLGLVFQLSRDRGPHGKTQQRC